MIDIRKHPIWDGSPLWGSISPIKKQGHLLRFFVAKQYAKLFARSMFVGITGSVGKTITTAACRAVLEDKYNTLTTATSLDPVLNIPITLLKARPGKTQKVILEMGIEYKGEMEFYLHMVKPGTGILTKISFAHSEFLGSPEDILKEKGKLIEQLPKDGYAILNYDDPLVRTMSQKTAAQVLFYGTDSKNCDVWVDNIKIENFGTKFELNYGVERVEISSQLLGIHQIYALMAAAALGISCDIPLTQIKKSLEKVEAQPHRMQLVSGFNGSVVIDDTHNAAFTAMEEAIDTLVRIPARRRIAVLGEMRELGEYSENLHRKIAQKIYKEKVDLVYLGQGETQFVYDELIKLGFPQGKLQANLQNAQIASKLLKELAKGDVVLVKGARSVLLGEVVKRISKNKK
jgi:UDP-N-acetylmuramoyl-tripeptide--D-alanyl-D-alanine ligase